MNNGNSEEKRRKIQFYPIGTTYRPMDGIEHYRVHVSQSARAKRSIDRLCKKKRSKVSNRRNKTMRSTMEDMLRF